jgi:hypothetical protein
MLVQASSGILTLPWGIGEMGQENAGALASAIVNKVLCEFGVSCFLPVHGKPWQANLLACYLSSFAVLDNYFIASHQNNLSTTKTILLFFLGGEWG